MKPGAPGAGYSRYLFIKQPSHASTLNTEYVTTTLNSPHSS